MLKGDRTPLSIRPSNQVLDKCQQTVLHSHCRWVSLLDSWSVEILSSRAPCVSARLHIGCLDQNERWRQEPRIEPDRSSKRRGPHAFDSQTPAKGNGVSVSRAQSSLALSCDPLGEFQRYLRTALPYLLTFGDHAGHLGQYCSLYQDRHSASFCDELRSRISS